MKWISTYLVLKDDVSAKLENGYLTITAAKGLDKDEKRMIKAFISAVNVMQVNALEPSMLAKV